MIIMRRKVFSSACFFFQPEHFKILFSKGEGEFELLSQGSCQLCQEYGVLTLLPRLIVSLFTNILDEVRSSDKSRRVYCLL